jgi:hypothetical protein
MSADKRLASVLAKTERAKCHIEELKRSIEEFLTSDPYDIEPEDDPQPDQRIRCNICRATPIPLKVATIAGDAIQNLRSSLDHLAFQLVSVSSPGGKPPDPHKIYFPIADTSAEHPSDVRDKMRGAREDILEAVEATQAYRGGNTDLWVLKRLNNIDKHRLLLPVVNIVYEVSGMPFLEDQISARFGDHMVDRILSSVRIFGDLNIPIAPLQPLEEGNHFFIPLISKERYEKLEFSYVIYFNEPDTVTAPIARVINDLSKAADAVIKRMQSFFD